ncbi:hypothetical protein C8J57DRAFT_1527056 [Mycena rebaudengoi]|nr:hypothetical protein C8J57DRAFT_1527056 [Mycena rebaudengoi]
MSFSARERIKKAHKGRETRGVLLDSTAQTIGSSTRSILCFAINSFLLLFFPLLASLLCTVVSTFGSASPWSTVMIITREALRDPHCTALLGSVYVYWTIACSYFLYLARPHALNIVKYQSFHTPWKYRRDHVSNMRLDRLRRAWKGVSLQGGTAKKDIPQHPDVFTVFVNIADGTVALSVTPSTTVLDLREAVCHHGHTPCRMQGPIYLHGLWRPLSMDETLSSLRVRSPRHFVMPPHPNKYYDDNGFEQCALNADGTSKDASEIDFSGDPGTPLPEASMSGMLFDS